MLPWVSTQDQDTAAQIEALKAAGCERVFAETASGAQRDRPELINALAYMRAGDTLVVWKLDRLARTLKQLVETVEMLGERKMGFLSLTEAIDTTSASGKLAFHIFAALSEAERVNIRERTRMGLDAARRMGRVGGRPRSIDDQSLRAAKAMLADEGLTVAEVPQKLGVAVSTLYRHLPGGRGELAKAA
jgi:DNA invertase Pin-like site-specific DNA recombinase